MFLFFIDNHTHLYFFLLNIYLSYILFIFAQMQNNINSNEINILLQFIKTNTGDPIKAKKEMQLPLYDIYNGLPALKSNITIYFTQDTVSPVE